MALTTTSERSSGGLVEFAIVVAKEMGTLQTYPQTALYVGG